MRAPDGGESFLGSLVCTATAGVALLTRQKCPKAIQGCALKTRRTGTPARNGCDGGPRKVARPCGERRAHRSGEGCPNQGVGSARLKRRLRPTRRSKSATPAVAVQIMPLQKPTPTILNHKNPARSFLAPGGKLDTCFIVLGCSLSSTASRCPTPAHKYPPCAGCSGRFPGRSHRTDPHPLPPRRK